MKTFLHFDILIENEGDWEVIVSENLESGFSTVGSFIGMNKQFKLQ